MSTDLMATTMTEQVISTVAIEHPLSISEDSVIARTACSKIATVLCTTMPGEPPQDRSSKLGKIAPVNRMRVMFLLVDLVKASPAKAIGLAGGKYRRSSRMP
jgi:hypothetical protein